MGIYMRISLFELERLPRLLPVEFIPPSHTRVQMAYAKVMECYALYTERDDFSVSSHLADW